MDNRWQLHPDCQKKIAEAKCSTVPPTATIDTEGEPAAVAPVLNDGEWKVEHIVKSRFKPDGEEEYLVKFEGYPESENQWIPAYDLVGQIPFTTTSAQGRTRYHKTKSSPVLRPTDTCIQPAPIQENKERTSQKSK